MENLAEDEDVATPSLPWVGSLQAVEVAGKRPNKSPPILSILEALVEVPKLLLLIKMLFLPVATLFAVSDEPIKILP